MAGFADDVAWLCAELRVEKPVIVGHSMGGVVAFEVGRRHPDLASAVVALDSPLLAGAEARARVAKFAETLEAQRRAAARDFVGDRLFIATDDPAIRRRWSRTCPQRRSM